MSWLSLLTNKWFAGGLAALFLASGCWITGNVHGHKAQSTTDQKALVTVSSELATLKTSYADALAAAKAKVAAQQKADAIAMEQIQKTYYQQGVTDANAKSDAVIAGLRAGTLRLRHEWTCPATADVPKAAEGGSGADEDADLRAADAGALVRLGAQADAEIKALQAIVRQDRQDSAPGPPDSGH